MITANTSKKHIEASVGEFLGAIFIFGPGVRGFLNAQNRDVGRVAEVNGTLVHLIQSVGSVGFMSNKLLQTPDK